MTPINPNIALNAQPPKPPDLMGQAAQFMQLKAQKQNMEMNKLQLGDFKRKLATEKGIRDIWNNAPDPTNLKQIEFEVLKAYGPSGLGISKEIAETNQAKDKASLAQLEKIQEIEGMYQADLIEASQLPEDMRPEFIRQQKQKYISLGVPEELLKGYPDDLDNESMDMLIADIEAERLDTEKRLKNAQADKAESEATISEQIATGTQPITLYQQAQLDKPSTSGGVDQQGMNAWLARPENANMDAADYLEHKAELGVRYSSSIEDINDTVDGIMAGELDPNLVTYSRKDRTAIAAGLSRAGYNQARAVLDFKGTNKYIQTLNSVGQMRLRQAIDTVNLTLPKIKALYDEWQETELPGGFKLYNKAALVAAANLPGEAGAIAANLQGRIVDIVSELATVYKGGNSPTDETLKLAAKNLEGEWNEETFDRAMIRLDEDMKIRNNSILRSDAVGVSSQSPYVPGGMGGGMQGSTNNNTNTSTGLSDVSTEELLKRLTGGQ